MLEVQVSEAGLVRELVLIEQFNGLKNVSQMMETDENQKAIAKGNKNGNVWNEKWNRKMKSKTFLKEFPWLKEDSRHIVEVKGYKNCLDCLQDL